MKARSSDHISGSARSDPRRGLRDTGFSSIEILSVVSILFLLVALAVPQVREIWNGVQRRNVREQFEYDLMRAKQAAAAAGARGILALSAGQNRYTFGIDYPPYSNPPVADEIVFVTRIPENAVLAFSQTILFDSRGFHIDKFGDLTQTTFLLSLDGNEFARGTIFPTGMVN